MNALLGSVNMMLQEIGTHDPRAVVMAFGQDAADYRVELFEGYHADREPMEDDIGQQFEQAPDLYAALGWRVSRCRDSRPTTCSAPLHWPSRTPAVPP